MKTLIKLTLVAVAVTALFFTGCKKENNDATTFEANMGKLITDNQPRKSTTTIPSNARVILIGKNTRITFYANAFIKANGSAVTGPVEVEIQEYYTKGQMVLANKTTTSNQGILDSRGEVYVNATQNGQQLRLRPGYSVIQFAGRSYNEPMNIYFGTVSGSQGDVMWSLGANVNPVTPNLDCSYDSINPPVFIDSATVAICDTLYSFQFDSLGWINCDYFYSYPNTTPLTVTLPQGYDNTNTTAYLVFSTINSVARFPYANGSFQLQGGYNVPVGMEATIVALAYVNGQWQSSFTPITIVNNHSESITFTPTTIEAYTTQVNAL